LANPTSLKLRRDEGGTFWLKSEPILTNTRTKTEPPRHRLASLGNTKEKCPCFSDLRATDFFQKRDDIFLWCSALQVFGQVAGLLIRSDGSAFLPPTPSCRAVLASAKIFWRAYSSILIIPTFASTSIKSLSFSILVPVFVPIMQGFFISREIIAAWQSIPPSSVTNAAAFSIAGI